MWHPIGRVRCAFGPCVPARVHRHARGAARAAPLALLCAAVAAGCNHDRGDEAPKGLLGELARELDAAQAISPRLSIGRAEPPCIAEEIRAAGDRRSCAPRPRAYSSGRIAAIAARAQRAVRDSTDPQAMHAAALIDLLYEPGAGKPLERAISSLQAVARLAERPAPVLADLAAAYLVRAERAHTPRDLVAAIEAATEALEREPGNRVARYNLALAMERLELLGEAAQGWRDYLAADSVSGWADEARRHLDRVLAAPTEPRAPAPAAPLTAYAAYAATEPQRARELGWYRVLGGWADAALGGDSANTEGQLLRAEALGTALERRPGGDATLADAVRAIRAQTQGPGLRRLARAHREFSAACKLDSAVEFAAAEPRFANAAALADASPPLRAWARLRRGRVIFLGGDRDEAETIFRQVSRGADSVRHPALAGRARQMLSASLLRGDAYDEADEQVSRARKLFERAGEGENEGSVLRLLSIARVKLRDMDHGYALGLLALERLRPYRSSPQLHNALDWLARVAAEDGFLGAALRIQDEEVRVAEETGEHVYVTEAHLSRAKLFAASGNYAGARKDVAMAKSVMARDSNAAPNVRAWMVAVQQMAEAPALLRTAPARAAAALDSAATFFSHTMDTPLLALPAIVTGVQAHLAAGDAAQGSARLDSALALLERRRDKIRMEPRRAAVFEEARALVDRATMLRLASGDSVGALWYLDRGRASLAPVGPASSRNAGPAAAGRRDEVALVYALVADTLLAWTVTGDRVALYRTELDTTRLIRTIEHLRRGLEETAGEAELRPGLSQLYEWLVRPLEGRLGPAETRLVVIADGVLASIPFAALYDAREKRYLVEDHALRSAASLREARRPVRRAGTTAASLFIADPAFDARAHPGFRRLAGAAAEAREIAAQDRHGQVLSGPAATRDTLRAALGRAALVHYAGHAVFDDERPERSFLLLAPAPGDGSTGILQAEEIAGMDLQHVSLVVLAACQTVRTGSGRAAGFSGLAGAFLAAGAGGAVGSLWEVDDRLSRPLMIELHRAYRAAPDGPGALRTAQLHLLRSGDPALRSPAAWAGFRYAGN
jgi:CHAT domain-containing protein